MDFLEINESKIDQAIKGAVARIMPMVEISGNDYLKREIKKALWETADFLKGRKVYDGVEDEISR